jgi:3-dehydrosphinganine reductase
MKEKKADIKINEAFKGKLAVICGGSMGIGKETARILYQSGASVCLIARTLDSLQQAAESIKQSVKQDPTKQSVKQEPIKNESEPNNQQKSQFIEIIACDTTDMDKLKPLLEKFIAEHGCPDYLINAVGYALPNYIQNLTLADFQNNMNVNYFGQLIPQLIVLPHMIQQKHGHIANVSSMMGYFGIIGYATYVPSKFAIVGLAEVLRHELKPYHISFSVLYPPDTNTPGLEKENLHKPEECRLVSGNIHPLNPEQVAEVFVKGIMKKQISILPGGSKMVWRLFRFVPWFVRWFLDRDLKKARKKLGKN